MGGLFAATGYPFTSIPIVGGVYNLADRFVSLLDRKEAADIGAMSPVWCFFGGAGAAVLALAPGAALVVLTATIEVVRPVDDGRPCGHR